MLYHHFSRAWKIADFGLAAEGSSNWAFSTTQSRGTTGYRAPELLQESHFKCTNKVDIWAFGCIIHDVIFLHKAFLDDFDTLSFRLKGVKWEYYARFYHRPEIILDENLSMLGFSILINIFVLDPSMRPTAVRIGRRLEKFKSDLPGTMSLLDEHIKLRIRSKLRQVIPLYIVAIGSVSFISCMLYDKTTFPKDMSVSRLSALYNLSRLMLRGVFRYLVYGLPFLVFKVGLEYIYTARKRGMFHHRLFMEVVEKNIGLPVSMGPWILAAVIIHELLNIDLSSGEMETKPEMAVGYFYHLAGKDLMQVATILKLDEIWSLLGRLLLFMISMMEMVIVRVETVLAGCINVVIRMGRMNAGNED